MGQIKQRLNELEKRIAALEVEAQERQGFHNMNRSELEYQWRRFELTTDDKDQIDELYTILSRVKLTRRELAVIAATLRIRSGFSLKDFGT